MSRARDVANSTTALNVDGTIKLDGNYPVGSNNVALGDTALDSNVSGASNTAIGADALTANTANNNVAVGYQSLYANTTGANNVALGTAALEDNTTASANIAVGVSALGNNTTGANNTAMGHQALVNNSTASFNTAVGYQAGYANTTGYQNAFFGHAAGQAITTGALNSFFGQGSGDLITTGTKNTIIGRYNGNQGGLDIRTSSNNIVLSDGDGNPRFNIDSNGHFFALALGSASTANNDVRYSTANGALYYQTSSARYKENIVDLEFDTSNLYNLRPVSFDDKATGERCYGLIAEETFEQIPELVVTREIDGEVVPDSIPYSMLSIAILNEMKKLKAELEKAQARIAALEAN